VVLQINARATKLTLSPSAHVYKSDKVNKNV